VITCRDDETDVFEAALDYPAWAECPSTWSADGLRSDQDVIDETPGILERRAAPTTT